MNMWQRSSGEIERDEIRQTITLISKAEQNGQDQEREGSSIS